MNTPSHYAAKARFFEGVKMFSSAAVLYRMAANAARKQRKSHTFRAAAKRCEAYRLGSAV